MQLLEIASFNILVHIPVIPLWHLLLALDHVTEKSIVNKFYSNDTV